MRFVARLFLVMLLSLGLLLPRVSVMLAEVTGAERVVFCDGSAMVVLALDEDGAPQRMAHDEPCGLVLVDLPLTAPLPVILPVPRPVQLARRRKALLRHPKPARRQNPRAPPLAF